MINKGLIRKRCFLFTHFAVNQEYRGKGIGKKLIQEAIKKAKESGIDCIELDVWSQNKFAKKFFKNLGFKAFNEKMSLNLK